MFPVAELYIVSGAFPQGHFIRPGAGHPTGWPGVRTQARCVHRNVVVFIVDSPQFQV